MRRLLTHCIAVSLTIGLTPFCFAQIPINSTQDGRIIQAGTYYNTPNSHTTFLNSRSGDLWLQSGSTVRGLEVNGSGNLTNNGGNIQLYAPKSVVRVDGNIDVSGIINGQGAYLGNGGKVQVNATYLYQNGSITALGNQGGHVNINVNSATFTPLAKIDTSSPTGLGGSIRVNASGVVDIQNGALMTTSGLPLAAVDANVIAITGRVVNNEGILNANGIVKNENQVLNSYNGGTIRLVANNGNPNLQQVYRALACNTVFTHSQSNAILSRLQGLANNYANSIRNTGSITANGGTDIFVLNGHGGDGGTVILTASRRILNQSTGVISANGVQGSTGGKGGIIQLSNQIPFLRSLNDGQIQANGDRGTAFTGGNGGNAGVITLKNLINNGAITANGGFGGAFGNSLGGTGGTINATNLSNTLTGTISAIGGGGGGRDLGHGGIGGNFTGTNIINAGTISVTGGRTGTQRGGIGGLGGQIQITSLTNSGLLEANGGDGITGGNGGSISLRLVNNTGTITANGGNAVSPPPPFTQGQPAGNGGTIIGTQVISNTGTVEALGGTSNVSPTFNGKDGTVIGF